MFASGLPSKRRRHWLPRLQLTREQPSTSALSCITNLTLNRYPLVSATLWNTRKRRNALDATWGDLCQETHRHLNMHPVYSDVERNFVFFVSYNASFCYVKHLHNLNPFQDSSSTREFVSVRSRPIHSHSLKHNPWAIGHVNTVAACHLLDLFTWDSMLLSPCQMGSLCNLLR